MILKYIVFILCLVSGSASISEPPTESPSATTVPSFAPTPIPSLTPSFAATRSPSFTPTTVLPTEKPTLKPTPSPTDKPTSPPSFPPTSQPSRQPTSQPSKQPLSKPSSQPSQQPSGQPSIQPTAQPFSQPSGQPSCQPTSNPSQPTRQPSGQPSCQPAGVPSSQPSNQPTSQPSQPSSQPTIGPSSHPSSQPNSVPTSLPSIQPSNQPTSNPSEQPSSQPSSQPTRKPSCQPTTQPSAQPSVQPSISPTGDPTAQPSAQPSGLPSIQPTSQPSAQPSVQPTGDPSSQPTDSPTSSPSSQPSMQPTSNPTCPTSQPTTQPSSIPSQQPSSFPTTQPTSFPSTQAYCKPGEFYTLTGHTNAGDKNSSYVCSKCPKGQYSPFAVKDRCKVCEPGYFAAVEGSTEQTLCPKNFYTSTSGTHECMPCGKGYVNGIEGSITSDDCLNTSINFIFGGLSLAASAVFIAFYLLFGRLHEVAFQRRHRLVNKCVQMYGVMITTADMVNKAASRLDKIKRENDENCCNRFLRKFSNNVVLPVVFLIVIFVVFPLVTIFVVLKSSVHIVFTTMVLWRAYNTIYSAIELKTFTQVLEPLADEVNRILSDFSYNKDLLLTIVSPIAFALEYISSFSINLKQVAVTCTGAQVPLYLLADLLIVFVVIIVIESQVYVFWTNMLSTAASKIRGLVFNRYYVWQNPFSCLAYMGVATCISNSPDPRWLVQYCMGFVVIKQFFNFALDAKSWVPSNDNCDGAIRYTSRFYGEVVNFPMDTILANATGVLVVIALPAIVYLLSVVLFALNDQRDRDPLVISFVKRLGTSGAFLAIATKEAFGGQLSNANREETSAAPAIPVQRVKHLAEDDWNAEMPEHTPKSRKQAFLDLNVSSREYVTVLHKRDDAMPWWARPFFLPLRKLSYLFSLDWFVMVIIFKMGKRVFQSFQVFLKEPRMVDAAMKREKPATADIEAPGNASTSSADKYHLEKSVKINKNAFDYDDTLRDLRDDSSNVQISELRFFGSAAVDDVYVTERQQERDEWKKVEETIPSYLKMIDDVRDNVKRIPWMQRLWLYKVFPYWLPTQLLTERGRYHWFRVFKTYFGMILVLIGIWPKWLVEDFQIIKKYDDFNKETNKLYTAVRTDFYKTNGETDAFTTIDNDGQIAFSQFISSLTVCRIALFQIVPVMTAPATFFTSVAAYPLIVFDKEMDSKLIPFIVKPWEAYAQATKLLHDDYGEQKTRIQAVILAYYIFHNKSRIIQFALNGFVNFLSMGIVFFPRTLKFLVPIVAFLLLHEGMLTSAYVILLFKKLFFPPVKTVEDRTELIRQKRARAEKKRRIREGTNYDWPEDEADRPDSMTIYGADVSSKSGQSGHGGGNSPGGTVQTESTKVPPPDVSVTPPATGPAAPAAPKSISPVNFKGSSNNLKSGDVSPLTVPDDTGALVEAEDDEGKDEESEAGTPMSGGSGLSRRAPLSTSNSLQYANRHLDQRAASNGDEQGTNARVPSTPPATLQRSKSLWHRGNEYSPASEKFSGQPSDSQREDGDWGTSSKSVILSIGK